MPPGASASSVATAWAYAALCQLQWHQHCYNQGTLLLHHAQGHTVQLSSQRVPRSHPPAPLPCNTTYRINDQRGPSVTVDSLLKKLDIPVLLLWGDLDPWIVPSRAAKIMALYPRAQKVGLQSGHCAGEKRGWMWCCKLPVGSFL
jgi:pimeloyl-ACP methyl ester carboxylesterase